MSKAMLGVAASGGLLAPDGTPINVSVQFNLPASTKDPRQVRQHLQAVLAECAARVVDDSLRQIDVAKLSAVHLPAEPASVKWVPMQRAVNNETTARLISEKYDISLAALMAQESWINGTYVCHVQELPATASRPGMLHLSIRRADRAAVCDWRDLQRIKNDICGPESEGAQLFPAESRLVDSSNQYHIWVFADGIRFPFGYSHRDVQAHDPDGLAKQRDWADGDVPALNAEVVEQGYAG
jgi:hypothetical protein